MTKRERIRALTPNYRARGESPVTNAPSRRRRSARSKSGNLDATHRDSAIAANRRRRENGLQRQSNCEYEEVSLQSCLALSWPLGHKKRRARPLAGPSPWFSSDDQTATTPCLALPWTGLCGRRDSRRPGGCRSLGPGLLTACWPLGLPLADCV